MKKITVVFFVSCFLFLTIGILAIGLYQHSQVDYQSYRTRIGLIRDIQENMAALTRNVLLVEEGEISHYDEVANSQVEIDNLMGDLPTE